MRDITHKPESRRSARAVALLRTGQDFADLLARAEADKGDALGIARIAGILAAKKTWEAIPLCHPIPVTHADVTFDVSTDVVVIEATCTTVAATGCEIEAMHGAAVAAVALYDVLKPHTTDLQIENVTLLEKTGGKSDRGVRLDPPAKAAILVTSDSVFAGQRADKAGAILRDRLESLPSVNLTRHETLPEKRSAIEARLDACLDEGFELILTVGGTGLYPGAVTVDAVTSRIEREAPGVMDAARQHGQRRTPLAMLSRGVAGVARGALLLTMPGTVGGVVDSADALFPQVLRVIRTLRRATAADAGN